MNCAVFLYIRTHWAFFRNVTCQNLKEYILLINDDFSKALCISQRTTAQKGKKSSKAGMMNMMVPFLPDLHYSTALWCKDLNFRAVYHVI